MKLLLIPLAILAFVLFLLLLGAIGLTVATGVIALCGRAWRFLSRAERRRERAVSGQQT